MRMFVFLFALVIGGLSPLALGQSRDGNVAGPSAVSNKTSAHSASADSPRANQPKSRSVFGQAMAELIRSVEDSRARRTQATGGGQQDTPPTAARVEPDHLALQSESDGE